jgi:hypothetical protein
MTIKEFDRFTALCKNAGFTTLAEVNDYMQARGLNVHQLCLELENPSATFIDGKFADDKMLDELMRQVRLGIKDASVRYLKNFVYIKTI